ncbi:MAG: 50S ribosomal protein L9 [Armatimonadetes bacterium]|nr:50S ribosomal protein L9 [Armatimonadota bacterium]
MKVVLLHDVAGVGKAGELATVADGYGRNYLVPRKLAMIANEGVMRSLEMQRKTIQRRAQRERHDAESVAARLQSAPIHIEAHTGVGGKLYGSVTTQDIADAVKKKFDIDVDRRKIDLQEPIRLVGSYTVPVRLIRDVVAPLTVNVTEPGGELPAPKETLPTPAPDAPLPAPVEETP